MEIKNEIAYLLYVLFQQSLDKGSIPG